MRGFSDGVNKHDVCNRSDPMVLLYKTGWVAFQRILIWTAFTLFQQKV